jgi:hypothetical protein
MEIRTLIKLNNIFLQTLLQDKYNIGVLTVNIEFMWLGTKRVERLAKARSFPRFYNNYLLSSFSYILYIYIYIY